MQKHFKAPKGAVPNQKQANRTRQNQEVYPKRLIEPKPQMNAAGEDFWGNCARRWRRLTPQQLFSLIIIGLLASGLTLMMVMQLASRFYLYFDANSSVVIHPEVKASRLCAHWRPARAQSLTHSLFKQPMVISRQAIQLNIQVLVAVGGRIKAEIQAKVSQVIFLAAQELRDANQYDYITHVIQSKRYPIIVDKKSLSKLKNGHFSGVESKIFIYYSPKASDKSIARTIRHEIFHAFINCIAPEYPPFYWYLKNDDIRNKLIVALCQGDNKVLSEPQALAELSQDYQPVEFPVALDGIYQQWQARGIVAKIERGESYVSSEFTLDSKESGQQHQRTIAIKSIELIDGHYVGTAITATKNNSPAENFVEDVTWRVKRLEAHYQKQSQTASMPELNLSAEHHAHVHELSPKIIAKFYPGLIALTHEILQAAQPKDSPNKMAGLI